MAKRARAQRRAAANVAPPSIARTGTAITTLVVGVLMTGTGVFLALSHQSESLPDAVQDVGPHIRLFASGDPFTPISVQMDARQAPNVTLTVAQGLLDNTTDGSGQAGPLEGPREVWLLISDPLGLTVKPSDGQLISSVDEEGDGDIRLTSMETQGAVDQLAVSFELTPDRPVVNVAVESKTPSFIHGAGFIVTPMPAIEVGLRSGMTIFDSDSLREAISLGDATAMNLFRAATIDGVDVYPPALSIGVTASPYDLLNPDTMAADLLVPQPSSFSPLGWSVTTAFRPYLQWRDLAWEMQQERQSVVAAVLTGVGSGLALAPLPLLLVVRRRRAQR